MAFPLIPLLSVGLQAAGSIFSFSDAKKARARETEAQAAAAKAMADAKAELEVNRLRGLSIAKEPYELEREALLQAGASALQAGVEGDPRGAAATAGRVLMAQQAQSAQQRAAMSREMQRLKELAAMEDTRLARARAQIDLGEAVGQQIAEKEARIEAAKKEQAGLSQGIKAGAGFLSVLPQLFPGTKDAETELASFGDFGMEDLMGVSGITPQMNMSFGMPGGFSGVGGIDYESIFPQVPSVSKIGD